MLIKEIEDDSKKWKASYDLVLEELLLLKWTYYPKQSTDLWDPNQNTNDIFHRTTTSNPKFFMEPLSTQNC